MRLGETFDEATANWISRAIHAAKDVVLLTVVYTTAMGGFGAIILLTCQYADGIAR